MNRAWKYVQKKRIQNAKPNNLKNKPQLYPLPEKEQCYHLRVRLPHLWNEDNNIHFPVWLCRSKQLKQWLWTFFDHNPEQRNNLFYQAAILPAWTCISTCISETRVAWNHTYHMECTLKLLLHVFISKVLVIPGAITTAEVTVTHKWVSTHSWSVTKLISIWLGQCLRNRWRFFLLSTYAQDGNSAAYAGGQVWEGKTLRIGWVKTVSRR